MIGIFGTGCFTLLLASKVAGSWLGEAAALLGSIKSAAWINGSRRIRANKNIIFTWKKIGRKSLNLMLFEHNFLSYSNQNLVYKQWRKITLKKQKRKTKHIFVSQHVCSSGGHWLPILAPNLISLSFWPPISIHYLFGPQSHFMIFLAPTLISTSFWPPL